MSTMGKKSNVFPELVVWIVIVQRAVMLDGKFALEAALVSEVELQWHV